MVKRENEARQAQHKTQRTITDFGRIVALFIARYGSECFDGGNINWHWFQFLSSHIPAIEAYAQVQMTQAIVLGGGIIMQGQEVMPMMNTVIDQIYE